MQRGASREPPTGRERKNEKLTSGGLFRKGRDALFSAFNARSEIVGLVAAGAKAEADPARAAARAAIFIMVGGLMVVEC